MLRPRTSLPVASLVLLIACGGSNGTSGHTSGAGGGHGSSSTSTSTASASSSGSAAGGGGTGGTAPFCGTTGWLTYNHDAQRTGASDGCVNGALSTKWRYVPAPPATK